MDFRKFLSPETLERMDAERAELARLYRLHDAWLAKALLQLARAAQAASPEMTPDRGTYDSTLIWGIVPEIARRLGVIKLTTNEIDWEIRELSDYELRVTTGHALRNIGWKMDAGWNMLTREACNGNPVVFAVDRLCPGRMGDANDPLAITLASIASARGTAYEGVWTPAIMKSAMVSEEAADEQTVVDRPSSPGWGN